MSDSEVRISFSSGKSRKATAKEVCDAISKRDNLDAIESHRKLLKNQIHEIKSTCRHEVYVVYVHGFNTDIHQCIICGTRFLNRLPNKR